MTWRVYGHEWAVTLLQQSLDSGRLAHAHLLSGPSQIGKTTLALSLAMALHCTQPDAPCGHCTTCRSIAGGTHPDVQLIVGEGARQSIKIDQIRALQRQAVLAEDWKLLSPGKGAKSAELYHISADPNEKQNLAEREAAKVTELSALLEQQRKLDP